MGIDRDQLCYNQFLYTLLLVFSFRGCVFSFPQENKKDGLRLFTEDMVEVKSLPRQSVLDHFIACAPTLVIPYLVDMVMHSFCCRCK